MEPDRASRAVSPADFVATCAERLVTIATNMTLQADAVAAHDPEGAQVSRACAEVLEGVAVALHRRDLAGLAAVVRAVRRMVRPHAEMRPPEDRFDFDRFESATPPARAAMIIDGTLAAHGRRSRRAAVEELHAAVADCLRHRCSAAEIARTFFAVVRFAPRRCELRGQLLAVGMPRSTALPGVANLVAQLADVVERELAADRTADADETARAVIKRGLQVLGMQKRQAENVFDAADVGVTRAARSARRGRGQRGSDT
jgi:hypothetical protein